MIRRTGFRPRQTLSQRATLKKATMVKKNTARRLVPKDETPIYSTTHLDLVRAHTCLVSGAIGCVAHHARGLVQRTMGVRVTDFLAVPLRPDLHDGYGHSLHKFGNEEAWWAYNGWPKERVFAWLRKFLLANYKANNPGVIQAFAKMATEEARAQPFNGPALRSAK